ncbi:hypothetical protein TNCV_4428591 [Trichonephila clavipes]|nr:hypothetical protein TNCV_4428591 [Trichonephila clavipes]
MLNLSRLKVFPLALDGILYVCGEGGLPTQGSSLSLDQGSEVRSPSPAAFVLLCNAIPVERYMPFRTSSVGHELRTGVSQVQVLEPKKTCRVKGWMHIKYVETQCYPVGVVFRRRSASSGVVLVP